MPKHINTVKQHFIFSKVVLLAELLTKAFQVILSSIRLLRMMATDFSEHCCTHYVDAEIAYSWNTEV